MFCKECGYMLDNKQIVCPNCGKQVGKPAGLNKGFTDTSPIVHHRSAVNGEKGELTQQREMIYLKSKLLPFFVFDCLAMMLFFVSAVALFSIGGNGIIAWIISFLFFLFIFALLPYLNAKHKFAKLCKKISSVGVDFETLLEKLREVQPYPFIVGCKFYFNNEYVCINYTDDLQIYPIRDLLAVEPVHLVTTTRAGLIPVDKEVSDYVLLKFTNNKVVKLITNSEFNTMRLTRELALAKSGNPITSSSISANIAENNANMNATSSNTHFSIKLTSKQAKSIRRKCIFTKTRDWIIGSVFITCIFLLPMTALFVQLGIGVLLVWIGIIVLWLFISIVCPVLSSLKTFKKSVFQFPI